MLYLSALFFVLLLFVYAAMPPKSGGVIDLRKLNAEAKIREEEQRLAALKGGSKRIKYDK